jgi:hypothetical protein
MSKTWSGMTTHEYKKHKGLKKENLRDNMTNTEYLRPPTKGLKRIIFL